MKTSHKNRPVRHCAECNVEMCEIKLVDATFPGMRNKGAQHVELSYTTPDARPSAFTASVPLEGSVRGVMCPQCGSISLYGAPLV